MNPPVFSQLTHLPRRGLRTALLAALLAVVLGSGVFALAPAPAAHAATNPRTAAVVLTARGSMAVIISRHSSNPFIPASASGCVGNLPWNNVQTCFGIVGSGKYVTTMWVSAYVRHTSITAALVITGPNYAASTDAFYTLAPGDKFTLYEYLNRNMTVGQYCGQSVLISGTGAGKACESVVA